ncbi:ABC transporter permease subunit [Bittarella massiliensis (ex Durand et al. 2017)]|uniref:ABC transporter permease subunit n=1 Tax=Bittarella massiliensis (ex Durand et al. 2017) TaxID=1720313 RepID=UPI00073ECB5F|nr:ABC transporter permease subunit [Bittarella massiliensis (ex Durand et al. 2017)]
MRLSLFREGHRSSWKLLVIFAAVLSLYISMITTMFDPEMGNILQQLSDSMPQLMAMVGMQNPGTTLVSFLSTYLYGMLLLAFPLVYEAITANRLVARQVERGSMAYLLAAPSSRTQVALTQASVLLTGTALLIGYCTGLGVLCAHLFFPGELDVSAFLLLNAGLLLLHFAVSGICFFASCLCNEGRTASLLGAGIPVLFLLMQMLSNMGGKLENLKYANLFTLFDPAGLIAGESSALWGLPVLAALGALLYGLGVWVFSRRDLPL